MQYCYFYSVLLLSSAHQLICSFVASCAWSCDAVYLRRNHGQINPVQAPNRTHYRGAPLPDQAEECGCCQCCCLCCGSICAELKSSSIRCSTSLLHYQVSSNDILQMSASCKSNVIYLCCIFQLVIVRLVSIPDSVRNATIYK